jgi:ATP-dependent helicase HrpA
MAAELVETTRLWAREVGPIDVCWVEEIGAHLVTRSHSDPWWDAAKGAAVARETVTLFGMPLITDRTVLLGRIDPEEARALFIRHALVHGEWETTHAFARRNAARIEEVHALEARERRVGLLADEEAVAAVFDRRLPPGITSVRDFDRWWRDERSRQPDLLDLTLEDLLDPRAALPDEDRFPGIWQHGDVAMPLEYVFDPQSPADGVTVEVPISGLGRVDPAVFQWGVPGRRAEMIESLIRALPKRVRRKLVPVPETVHALLDAIDPQHGGLLEQVRRELSRIAGEPILPGTLDLHDLPAHLRPRFRVIGESGAVLAEGDDLGALRQGLVDEARQAAGKGGHELERSGITSWDFGELATSVEIGPPGRRAPAYPALVDEGESVAIRLLATGAEQEAAMPAGTRRLILLGLPSPQKLLRPLLTDAAVAVLRSSPYETRSEWIGDCLDSAADRVVDEAGGPAWDAVGFDRLLDRARDDLAELATAIGEESLALLDTRRIVRTVAEGLPERLATSGADLLRQLDRLVFPGFLAATGAGRIPDVHRYLRAAEYRLDKLPEDPERDRAAMARVLALVGEHDRLRGSLPPSPALTEITWMLEELRVSLFAQPLGTRGKVSEKRIRRALADAAGLA